MWDVENHTPFATGGLWWRDTRGVHAWLVGIKASYEVGFDGTVALLDEQEDVNTMPVYDGDPDNPSIRYESDVLPLRSATDVVLNATGYAPGLSATEQFTAGIRLDKLQKILALQGPRFWVDDGSQLRPGPVNPTVKVPVTWQNAMGGYFNESPDDPSRHRLETRNPCGSGAFGALGVQEGDCFPQVFHPEEAAHPAGFAPIPVHWQPRQGLTGTYDAKWEKNVMPLLPKDWSRDSQQCAVPDQQIRPYLRGGEPVELVNLTPNGRVRFNLPKIGLTCLTTHDGRDIRHRPRLVCVIFEPDYFETSGRLMMIWNTEIEVRHEIDYLERTLVQERPYAA